MSKTNNTAALTLLAALCFVPAAYAVTDQTTGKDTTAKSDIPPESSPTTFVKKAASVGIAEVELGKMAEQRGSSSAVKAFGKQMVTDHGKANQELQSLAAKKNIEIPTTLDAKHAELRDQLATKSGVEFDQAYMEEMTKGHEKVVEEFSDAAKSSTDKDVKTFAANSLPMLEGHLQKATAIQASLPQARVQ